MVHNLEVHFGLPRNETLAYLRLLERGDLTAEEIGNLLSVTKNEAAGLLEKMLSRGLVIKAGTSGSRFAPLHPRMMLTNIFKQYEAAVVISLRERRATVDRVVNLLTPIFEERTRKG